MKPSGRRIYIMDYKETVYADVDYKFIVLYIALSFLQILCNICCFVSRETDSTGLAENLM